MKNFKELTKNWSEKRKKRVEIRVAELQAELKVELNAAQDYYERTGYVMQNLDPVARRKIVENWKEDHQWA